RHRLLGAPPCHPDGWARERVLRGLRGEPVHPRRHGTPARRERRRHPRRRPARAPRGDAERAAPPPAPAGGCCRRPRVLRPLLGDPRLPLGRVEPRRVSPLRGGRTVPRRPHDAPPALQPPPAHGADLRGHGGGARDPAASPADVRPPAAPGRRPAPRPPPPPADPPPASVPEPHEIESVRLLLRDAGGAADEPIVLLNPNCSDLLPLRAWPSGRYVELARRLLDHDPRVRVVMTGAPSEQDEVAALVRAVGSD